MSKDFDLASWWYQEEGETRGPVSGAELRRLAMAKKLQPDTLVWREDFGEEWRPLSESGFSKGADASADVSDRWKKTFAKIEAAKATLPTNVWGEMKRRRYPYSVLGFIFGPLYYLYLRMWHKALAIIAFGAVLLFLDDLSHVLFSTPRIEKLINLIPAAVCASMAKHDYYMFKVHGEKMWSWKPIKPLRNIYVAGAVAATFILAYLLVPVEASATGDILSDLSGVWATNGLTLAVDLGGSSKEIIVNGRPAEVTVTGSSDDEVTLSPSATPNKVITLKRLWSDASHKQFKIAFLAAGRSLTLGYQHALGEAARQASPARTADTAAVNAGISGSYCQTGKTILEGQTFQMRASNIPVDDALDSFVKEENVDYMQFMMASVRQIYADPDSMREKLNNGIWMRACITAVRGF